MHQAEEAEAVHLPHPEEAEAEHPEADQHPLEAAGANPVHVRHLVQAAKARSAVVFQADLQLEEPALPFPKAAAAAEAVHPCLEAAAASPCLEAAEVHPPWAAEAEVHLEHPTSSVAECKHQEAAAVLHHTEAA